MNTIFYIGFYMSLQILSFIMCYTIFKPQSNIVKVSYSDIAVMSFILSLGITLMYIGVFK